MNNYFSIQSKNNDFINRARTLAEDGTKELVFIALDISNFKYINDFYGMDEGDKVMQDIASYFFINEPRCVAAYGMGFDQFRGIYDWTDMTKEGLISYLVNKSECFEAELAGRYPLIYNHVYLGLYFYEDRTVDVRVATDRANLAKKATKGKFNIKCQVFTDNNCKEYLGNMDMANMFVHALEENRLELYIQPKVSVLQKSVVGGEALVRMRDEEGNIVPPGRFVPVLEATGLVDRLDEAMIEKVFAFQRKCIDEGRQVYTISVNVSRQEFARKDFLSHVLRLREQYQVSPELIEFELLESTFVNDLSSIIENINVLREKGFLISVDDFGAGYSSLNQIANIPADIIKLDGRFARESLKTVKGQAVIKSLIAMLNAVDYGIVFEGVETEEQKEMVVSYGCDVIQGYYYSMPIPEKEFLQKYGESCIITV